MVLELREARVETGPETWFLRSGDLIAEYSLTRSAQTGEWVAVGSVRHDRERQHGPVWVLVGVGISETHAIEDLQRELERAAVRAIVVR